MAHLAQGEERDHKGEKMNNAIVGGVMHHQVHQDVEADTNNQKYQKTNHMSGGRGC